MSGAIWLASYPRSGNTWTRIALNALQNGEVGVDFKEVGRFGRMATTRERIDRSLEVDSSMLTPLELAEIRPDAHARIYAGREPPELAKVHDAWILSPSGRPVYDAAITHAAIYLIRDPRDAVVSWARFVGWELDKSIAFLCSPRATLAWSEQGINIQVPQPMGRWADHARSWIDRSGLDPLVVRYEDMLADPGTALTAMVGHIGWDVSPAAIAAVVDATQFDRLAAKEKREGFTERAPAAERFFHTGKSGTWRDVLSAEQAGLIERELGETMARFGYL